MTLLDFFDLRAGFRKYFEVVPAVDTELIRECFRIRHEVYCRELGFEAERADGLETDEYDRHAVHCLLRARTPREYVGCIRIVLARPEDPMYPLPFERTCEATIDRSIVDPRTLDRMAIAEVSRLAVISRYRRRKGESGRPVAVSDADFGDRQRPRFPYIPVGLYMGILSLAASRDIRTLFVLTEPRLATHLRRLGVGLRQIGGPVEHRGLRVPSMMDVGRIVDGMNRIVRPLYQHIDREISQATPPSGQSIQGRA